MFSVRWPAPLSPAEHFLFRVPHFFRGKSSHLPAAAALLFALALSPVLALLTRTFSVRRQRRALLLVRARCGTKNTDQSSSVRNPTPTSSPSHRILLRVRTVVVYRNQSNIHVYSSIHQSIDGILWSLFFNRHSERAERTDCLIHFGKR